jgi:hypothetical protein
MAAEITIASAAAEAVLDQMPGLVAQATARALNRGILASRTVMVREMSRDLGMRQADLRDRLRIVEATGSRLSARLSVSGKRLPLITFSARGPEPSRGKGRGVSYRLPGGGRNRHPHAFISTMRTGHRGVFVRARKGRLPIRELFGPSLPRVFGKFRPQALARGLEQFRKTLIAELQFRRGRAASGTA